MSDINEYVFLGRIVLEKEPVLSMQCEHIRRRITGNTVYKQLEHPYAVARNVYQSYYLQELLLSFSYSPSNFYCYALDNKSHPQFKSDLMQMGSCFPNVFVLEKEFPFDSDGRYQDNAHYDCTQELLNYPGWEYVMFLQNADILTKTPQDISKIISSLNGTFLSSRYAPDAGRVPESSWKPKDLKLPKNESQWTPGQLNTPMKVWKSPNHVFLPRTFMKEVTERLNLTTVFDMFNKMQYGMDEMFFISLISAHTLNLPGQIENQCNVGDFFRYVHWNWGPEKDCLSFVRRHGVCLLGMEYVPLLTKQPYIIANKIWPELDFGAMMCLGEILYNRTNIDPSSSIDLQPYKDTAPVREMNLKATGRFNLSTFSC